MNKTDKLLYGGFAVVALGGIVAMLVSVFSPTQPPQKQAEEVTAEQEITPVSPAEYSDILDRWRQGVENARLQREQDEALAEQIKNDPELAKLIQEEEAEKRAKEEAERAEKEWWESRQDWVDRFPFEPTPHPEISFDPTVYDPNNLDEWREEEKGDDYWKMAAMVRNHGFLKRFYESKVPYTEEFEQMYDIIKEEIGEDLDPVTLGWTFETIRKYHQAKQLDPDSIYQENAHVRRPMPEQEPVIIAVKDLPPEEQATLQNMTKQEKIKFVMGAADEIRRENNPHFNSQFEVRDVTWGDESEILRESILGELTEDDSRLMSMEKATEIRDRLLNEIPAAGFLEKGHKSLCYVSRYERELKPGDPLLIR